MLSACLYSLQPFYTNQDVVFKPALLGTWTSVEKNEYWVFSSEDPARRSYRLVVHDRLDERKSIEAHAVLFRLESFLFLDLAPSTDESDPSAEDYLPYQPPHLVLLVESMAPTLRLASLNYRGPSDAEFPAHVREGSGFDTEIILTAPTKDLQTYLLNSAKSRRSSNFLKLSELLPGIAAKAAKVSFGAEGYYQLVGEEIYDRMQKCRDALTRSTSRGQVGSKIYVEGRSDDDYLQVVISHISGERSKVEIYYYDYSYEISTWKEAARTIEAWLLDGSQNCPGQPKT